MNLSPAATLLLLFLPVLMTDAFVLPTFHSSSTTTTTTTTSTTLWIGNLLGNKDKSDTTSLPRDVKDAVSKCRMAVQSALQNKCSRMDIEMPVGAKFGVEPSPNKQRSSSSKTSTADGPPLTQETLQQSDRELARLFVEMFQPVGGSNIAVVFNDMGTAQVAQKKWKTTAADCCRILAIDRKKKGAASVATKKKKKAMGFAAKIAAEVDDSSTSSSGGGALELPGNIEVALFVAPGAKELIQVEKICNQVGMGTLVVLLNARLSSIPKYASEEAKKLFEDEFEPVFALKAAPQQQAPNCLLYRSYPGSWVLARKPKVGPPKPILTQTEQPTPEQCQLAFDSLQLSDVEKGLENVLENVAGWFN